MGNICRKIEICNEIDDGLQQAAIVKNRQRSDFVGQNVFVLLLQT